MVTRKVSQCRRRREKLGKPKSHSQILQSMAKYANIRPVATWKRAMDPADPTSFDTYANFVSKSRLFKLVRVEGTRLDVALPSYWTISTIHRHQTGLLSPCKETFLQPIVPAYL